MPALTKKQLLDQLAELTTSLQRERADSENLRRRAELEQSQALASGQRIAIAEMLPILDNLERAFADPPKNLKTDNWVKGILGLNKQLKTIMDNLGLEKIKTVGQAFDPDCMAAVSVDDQGGDSQTVVEQLQAGYRLDGQVIRVAMVKVQA